MSNKKDLAAPTAVSTMEEWASWVDKPRLKVVDVYSKWSGPCEAIVNIFKRIKLDLGDQINFLQVNTDSIDDLSNYRNKSRPTFLFFYDQILVKIVNGANAPLIEKTINEQLELEKTNGIHVPYLAEVSFPLEHKKLIAAAEGQVLESLSTENFLKSQVSLRNVTKSQMELNYQNLEKTLAFIKPDAMHPQILSQIFDTLKRNRFEIMCKRKCWLTYQQAEELYAEHKETVWFERVCQFMSSAPILVFVLARENAVELWRQTIGPTSSHLAKDQHPKTLRALFGTDNMLNAVFGSSSVEAAEKEIEFFFGEHSTDIKNLEFHEKELDSVSVTNQKTLVLIKPDVCGFHGKGGGEAPSGNSKAVDEIVERILWRGFKIIKREELNMPIEQAQDLYDMLKEEEYFNELVDFMASGPSIALVIKGEDVVRAIREIAGETDPDIAKKESPMSIRAKFGTSKVQNALYVSESIEDGMRDIQILFPHIVMTRQGSQMISKSQSVSIRNSRVSLTTVPRQLLKKESQQQVERTLCIIKPDAYKEVEVEVVTDEDEEVEVEVEVELDVEVEVEVEKTKEEKLLENPEDPDSVTTLKKEMRTEKRFEKKLEKVIKKKVVKNLERTAFKEILDYIREKGFKVVGEKEFNVDKDGAKEFYKAFEDDINFDSLVENLTSGPCYALVLEANSAINLCKELVGPASPEKAKEIAPKSLRALFGTSDRNNAIHCSDSPMSAEKEIFNLFRSEVSPYPDGIQRGESRPHLINHDATFHSRENSTKTEKKPEEQKDVDNALQTSDNVQNNEKTFPTRTLALIKPDAYGSGKKDQIVAKIIESGFTIIQEKEAHWNLDKAKAFYKEHEGKPFYDELTEWMSSAPIYTLVLEKNDAVTAWRTLAGPTNSVKARESAPESIRALFGTDGSKNAVHGSDSDNSASREINIVFGDNNVEKVDGITENENKIEDVPVIPTQTLALIKPDAYGSGKKDEILKKIIEAGFTIAHERETHWTVEKAKEFYKEHEGKPFYDELTEWMSSAPIYTLVLEKNDAVTAWRTLAGPTNSIKARESAPDSIRALFGTDGSKNAVHGSDSVTSAEREIGIVFEDLFVKKDISTANEVIEETSENKKKQETSPTQTLALIKPDAYGSGKKDEIVSKILSAGFTIVHEREDQWDLNKAKEFYKEHEGKPFFDTLTQWMSSAPIYTLVLEKDDAVTAWRTLAGPTNSLNARESAPDSIRALFGTDGSQNAVHGSDSNTSAEREISLVFSDKVQPKES
ncbi:thioredoxin domain-containing protein 6 [Clydaea vesicula]|uniref:Nucleoside diphosphate kinase n=1 Tax=Clydaea vesicula TaxID=447962 RepID=A0AAD5TYT4_9FUNG|nr:thioredoxin domain-containing protein 6 [Clydaea vesicula]